MRSWRKQEVFYTCCQCNVKQQWAKSRCDTILSDGRPCNHRRHEHHCRVFGSRPNYDDRILKSEEPRQHIHSGRSETAARSSPLPSALVTPAREYTDTSRAACEAYEACQTDAAAHQPDPEAIPEPIADQNVVRPSSKPDIGIQLDTERQDPPCGAPTQHLPSECGTSEPQTSATGHEQPSSSGGTTGRALTESGGVSGPIETTETSRSRLGAVRKPKGKNTSRPKYGMRSWDSTGDKWSLACPYDKFLPGQSDCVHFTCQAENDLHRRHMRSHVKFRDISENEYSRLTSARKFQAGEAKGLSVKEQDWKHWQKQYVAIYTAFGEVENSLNPEKSMPLLEDNRLFQELQRRQLRHFENGGFPLPYAYLPRRHELAVTNTRPLTSSSNDTNRSAAMPQRILDTQTPSARPALVGPSSHHGPSRRPPNQEMQTKLHSLPECPWSESHPFGDLEGLGHDFAPPLLPAQESNIDGATPSSSFTTDASSVFSPGPGLTLTPGSERSVTPTFRNLQNDPGTHDLIGYHNRPPLEVIWVDDDRDEFTRLMALKQSEERLEAWRKTQPKRQKLLTDFHFVDDDID